LREQISKIQKIAIQFNSLDNGLSILWRIRDNHSNFGKDEIAACSNRPAFLVLMQGKL
jgi:hypothetical protein